MNRFVDGVNFVPVDTPPRTPSQLFLRLGVYGASDEERRVAIAEWLEHNDPVTNLRLALEYRGLIPKRPGL